MSQPETADKWGTLTPDERTDLGHRFAQWLQSRSHNPEPGQFMLWLVGRVAALEAENQQLRARSAADDSEADRADLFALCDIRRRLAELEAENQQVDCPLCGKSVVQVASATLSLALWQHFNWTCEPAKVFRSRLTELEA